MLYSGQGYQTNCAERGIGMVNLSKSKYCALWQCPKMLWLRKYSEEHRQTPLYTEFVWWWDGVQKAAKKN